MPKRSKVAPAATASGGETIAPSTNADAQPNPGASHSTAVATANVLTITSPTASSEIGRTLRRSSSQSVTQPPWKSNGGRTV